MHAAAAALRQRGIDFEAAATHLEQASTHWIRHTAGSHLSEKVDLKVVRDNLGHANISTTSIYLHTEDDARHDATAVGHRVAGARRSGSRFVLFGFASYGRCRSVLLEFGALPSSRTS